MRIPKGGMYGSAVLAVLVAVAIFLTVAMDVQETTRDVTKYDYITDTTGLFEYTDNPQYNDYDLSKNYTGYFIESKSPYWSGIGFYEYTSTVNNYKLNLEPVNTFGPTTKDLTTPTWTDAISDDAYVSYFGPDGEQTGSTRHNGHPVENNSHNTRTVYLRDILTEYGLETASTVTITPVDSTMASRVIFGLASDFIDNGSSSTAMYTAQRYIDDYAKWINNGNQIDTTVAGLSCVIDNAHGIVYYYNGTNGTDFLKTVDLDDAIIIFGGTSLGPRAFGTSVEITSIELPPNQYLNVRSGVSVSTTGA